MQNIWCFFLQKNLLSTLLFYLCGGFALLKTGVATISASLDR
jgi:hypothetical protein